MMKRANVLGSVADFQNTTFDQTMDDLNRDLEKLDITGHRAAGYRRLYSRWMAGQDGKIDWEKIQPPTSESILDWDALENKPFAEVKELLEKLVVLKLNGGLGTTMGCTGPKSVIEVTNSMTFLDMTVRQIEWLNENYGVDVPLVLMNSFNTHEDTDKVIRRYERHNINIYTFNQSQYPRILKETGLPLPETADAPKDQWYPPGHGDIYESFYRSGLLESFLQQNKHYLFLSNVDNLGATVSFEILSEMAKNKRDFIMEVTNKTRADVKGGTLIDYEGSVRLLEIAQVPKENVEDFKSVRKFKIFNTNNLWISLPAIKSAVESDSLNMDIIVNPKKSSDGRSVIQLETACGAAIQFFQNSVGINVPRSRFLPVKSCSDLFLVQSNLYQLSHGSLTMSSKRMFPTVPLVKLGDAFKTVTNYQSRFKGSKPDILELDHLTVSGDVTFGSGVVLKGTVIIVANVNDHIDIPDGAVLCDQVITGSLRILNH